MPVGLLAVLDWLAVSTRRHRHAHETEQWSRRLLAVWRPPHHRAGLSQL